MSIQKCHRLYDADFECNVVRLSEELGISISQLSNDLAISHGMPYSWQTEF